jgi:sodium/hydrogen exchanger 8
MFETLIFIFLGIGFFSFRQNFSHLSVGIFFITLALMLIGRMFNIFLCSRITNLTRHDNHIDNKKQFFLWFSGARGAMAFALSLKSVKDFPEVGYTFLLLTLFLTLFTIIYTSLFLDYTLHKCEVIYHVEADNFDENFEEKNCFQRIKKSVGDFNTKYIMKTVYRDHKEEGRMSSPEIHSKRDVLKNSSDEHSGHHEKNFKMDHLYEEGKKEDSLQEKRNVPIKNMHLFE